MKGLSRGLEVFKEGVSLKGTNSLTQANTTGQNHHSREHPVEMPASTLQLLVIPPYLKSNVVTEHEIKHL